MTMKTFASIAARRATCLGVTTACVLLLPLGCGDSGGTNTESDAQAVDSSEDKPIVRNDSSSAAIPASTANRTPDRAVRGQTAAQTDAAAPPFEFRPLELDMGHLSPGDVYNGTIEVHNPTNETITIVESRASCNCTAVDLADTPVPPGESVDLNFSFDSEGKLGPTKIAIRLTAVGYSTWAQTSVVGEVSLPVAADPAYIVMQPARGDSTFAEVTQGEIEVRSIDNQPFRILSSGGSQPVYTDGFSPDQDSPRSSYRLQWDLSEYNVNTCTNAAGERMPPRWIIETTHPECALLDLQVRHKCNLGLFNSVNRNFRLAEGRVIVGPLATGESKTIEVPVRWFPRAPKSQQFIAAKSLSPDFDVEYIGQTGVADGMKVQLRVTPKTTAPGVFEGMALIDSTNDQVRLQIIGTNR